MLPGICLWNNLQQFFWLFLFSVKFSVLIVFVLEIRREVQGGIRAIQSQIWIKKGENHFWNFSCCKKNCSLLFLKLDDHHFRHRKTQIHLSSYKAPVKYTLQSASWNKQLKEIMINEVEEERGHIVIFWNEEPEEIPQNPKTSKQQITSMEETISLAS